MDALTVDGSPATLTNGAYTFSSVIANHTIEATFATDTLTTEYWFPWYDQVSMQT